MKDKNKFMDFEVESDLREKGQKYNIKIELENEIEDSNVREFAINLAGSVVRNNEKCLYGEKLSINGLSELIKETLNKWVPNETEFVAKSVEVTKLVLTRN